MSYRRYFANAIGKLEAERRYRVFADLERSAESFPSALWHRPGYGRAGMVLLLATAWCLAVGVFSQILWDDRPITAPLAHLSWRSGR